MALEIERKFLLSAFPYIYIEQGVLSMIKQQNIEQTYLAIAEDQQLRVRKLTDLTSKHVEYTHTFKAGKGMVREEIEYSIGADVYEQLISGRSIRPLIKTRTTCTLRESDAKIEIDQYQQLDLIVAEVEFQTEEKALHYIPPLWFGEDISLNKQYSNTVLWQRIQSD